MSRPLRIQYENATYHVYSKGQKGEHVFNKDEDKDCFIRILGKGAERYRINIYAYCVMGNHYHLLLQTQESNLSVFMHYLGSSYANYLSRNGWCGHVFAQRYNAICVDKEEYFLAISRYIHLNPVAAEIVERPDNYQWSSYALFTKETDLPIWYENNWLIEYFGPRIDEAKERYKEFIEGGMEEPCAYPEEKVIAQAVLGNEQFLDKVQSIIDKRSKPSDFIGRKGFLKHIKLENIYQIVCYHHNLHSLHKSDQSDIKKCLRARKQFIYIARELTTSTNREISGMLGDIGPHCISVHYRQIKDQLMDDLGAQEKLKKELKAIIGKLET